MQCCGGRSGSARSTSRRPGRRCATTRASAWTCAPLPGGPPRSTPWPALSAARRKRCPRGRPPARRRPLHRSLPPRGCIRFLRHRRCVRWVRQQRKGSQASRRQHDTPERARPTQTQAGGVPPAAYPPMFPGGPAMPAPLPPAPLPPAATAGAGSTVALSITSSVAHLTHPSAAALRHQQASGSGPADAGAPGPMAAAAWRLQRGASATAAATPTASGDPSLLRARLRALEPKCLPYQVKGSDS